MINRGIHLFRCCEELKSCGEYNFPCELFGHPISKVLLMPFRHITIANFWQYSSIFLYAKLWRLKLPSTSERVTRSAEICIGCLVINMESGHFDNMSERMDQF